MAMLDHLSNLSIVRTLAPVALLGMVCGYIIFFLYGMNKENR